MFWKIYFFIYSIPSIIAILFNFSEGKMELTNSINTVLYIVGFIAFFNFVFTKKKVFNDLFWKAFFFTVITWDISFSFVIYPMSFDVDYNYYFASLGLLLLIPRNGKYYSSAIL
jgi:hypothetical protein